MSVLKHNIRITIEAYFINKRRIDKFISTFNLEFYKRLDKKNLILFQEKKCRKRKYERSKRKICRQKCNC